jgi:hypothetical protein
MHAAEVVMHVVERNRVAVIVHLLAEAVGQTSEPAHLHSHGEVLPFHIAGTSSKNAATGIVQFAVLIRLWHHQGV